MDVVSDHVHGHGLAICANGAAVVDLHAGGKLVKVRPLDRDVALDVVHTLRAAAPGTSFAVELTTGIHYEPAYPPFHLDPGATVAIAEKLLHEEVRGYRRPRAEAARAPRRTDPGRIPRRWPAPRPATGRPSPAPAPPPCWRVSGPGVSKASTLALCCAERGISPAEVVAFGDMPNDVEMLSWAGTSYAMGNAHPGRAGRRLRPDRHQQRGRCRGRHRAAPRRAPDAP